jgi:uncharacterized protein YcbX
VRVLELWRYPVKSLQGERLEAVEITAKGLDGDRQYALFDVESGLGLTARRVPELLFASARLDADGSLTITLPDGSTANDDEALSVWLGRPVALRSADADVSRYYENPNDFEHEQSSEWHAFLGASGPFHDSVSSRVSLVSIATLGDWDRRRFRSNILLDGDGEDELVGSRVRLGEAELSISKRIPRCVMVTRAQSVGIERDLSVLRTIARERDACLAIGALVSRTGCVRVGDRLEPAEVPVHAGLS